MEGHLWWIWAALAALFIVGEIFTAGFFLLWFGIGAAVAAVFAYLKIGPGYQLGAFVVVSTALVALSRKFAKKVTVEHSEGVGADRLLGRKGVVLEEIDSKKGTGLVRVDRDEWRAESQGEDVISAGEWVEVVQVSGTHVIVRREE